MGRAWHVRKKKRRVRRKHSLYALKYSVPLWGGYVRLYGFRAETFKVQGCGLSTYNHNMHMHMHMHMCMCMCNMHMYM